MVTAIIWRNLSTLSTDIFVRQIDQLHQTLGWFGFPTNTHNATVTLGRLRWRLINLQHHWVTTNKSCWTKSGSMLVLRRCTNINHYIVVIDFRRQNLTSTAGLGRVLDKSTRVQVQVLEKMTSTSTSTSTGFSKVLEYKYKYFEKYLSTSTEYFGCKL